MNQSLDPIGLACLDYLNGKKHLKIVVKSDFVEDDHIPSSHLFRQYNQMAEIEQKALDLCNGRVLDVGAGAGSHALFLQENGIDVTALEISQLACQAMTQRGLKQVVTDDFFTWNTSQQFDTILMMMNGIGIVGQLSNMETFFKRIKQLLLPGGQLLLDSSDLCYLFEDEDTEELPEMMDNYYGEVNYQMVYKQNKGDWFKWLFIDPKMLAFLAEQNGFKCQIVLEGNHYEFLAKLTMA